MAKMDLGRVVEAYRVIYKELRNSLEIEFQEGRIKGSEFSQILLSIMNNAMQLAFQVPMQDYQICLTQSQIENTLRDIAYKDDLVLNQLLQIQINGWAEAFKAGMLEDIPTIISNDEASILYNTIKEKIQSGDWNADCGIEPVNISNADTNCNTIQGE